MKNEINLYELFKVREQDVYDIMQLLKTNNRVISVKYTGFGKSYYIIPSLLKQFNSNAIIIVPNKSLEQQYKDRYSNKNVKVLTYQIIKNYSDNNILNKFKDTKYIICDECHHLGNNKWRIQVERLEKLLNAKIIGLTATPERGDGISVINDFFNGIQTKSLELVDGIANGFVPKIKYIVAYADLDEDTNRKLKEIDRYRIKNLINVPNILNKYIDKERLNKNLKILVYVSRLKYINEAMTQCREWFSSIYPNKKLNLYSISSLDTPKQNSQILQKFEKNNNKDSIDILVSVNKIVEGLHLPTVSLEIMLRKTKSPVIYQQQIGRVINSDQPIIFDLINNSNQLYQLQKDYNDTEMNIFNTVDRTKTMFDNCIELISETKDIQTILNMYIPKYREEYYKKVILENREYIESMSRKLSYKQLAKEFDLAPKYFTKVLRDLGINFENKYATLTMEQAEKIFVENINYVKDSMGKVSLENQYKHLRISRDKYKYLLDKYNIKKVDMWSKIEYDNELIHKFADLYNNGLTRKDIQKELNLNDSLYLNYMKKCKELFMVTPRYKRTITMKQREFVINNSKDYTTAMMADMLGISRKNVYDICKQYNLEFKKTRKRKPKEVTPELIKTVLNAYKKYKSYRKTALELDLGEKQVKNIVTQYGNPISKGNPSRKPLTDDEKKLIVEDYKLGLTKGEIEQKYHRSHETVNAILHEAIPDDVRVRVDLTDDIIKNIQYDYNVNNYNISKLCSKYRRGYNTIKSIINM